MTGCFGTGTRALDRARGPVFVVGRRQLDGKDFTKYILLVVTLARLLGKGDGTLCFGSGTPASQVRRGHLDDFFSSSNEVAMM